MAQRVIVIIDPVSGQVTYEVEGVEGARCTDLTNVLTAGKKVLEQTLKNEYYDEATKPDYLNQGE